MVKQDIGEYGYLRVAACSPDVVPGDIEANVKAINSQIAECIDKGVDIAVFPELCITGYTCADLFDQKLLLDRAMQALQEIGKVNEESFENLYAIVGAPMVYNNCLYNCAFVIYDGVVKGIVPKSYLPNYGEFYERRWFKPGVGIRGRKIDFMSECGNYVEYSAPFGTDLLFECGNATFGIEICEDLWVPTPPSSALSMAGADVIFNLSATNELIGKHRYLVDLVKNQSARCRAAYVYASAGTGESSTDLAFAGTCLIAENGSLLAESERFTLAPKRVIADIDIDNLRHDRQHFGTFGESVGEKFETVSLGHAVDRWYKPRTTLTYRRVDSHPFVDSDPDAMQARVDEISSIQSWGLAMRLRAIHCKKAVVGISGGLDSTLALLVTVKAFDLLGLDRKGIIGITMPGFGTTDRTKGNASKLMDMLGVTEMEIPIAAAVSRHFSDIGQDPAVHDVTYENSQARERTQILMDIANKENAIVVGTGDLSELALGWCTYNGDQMSMYGVNASIPKTLVKYLVEGYARQATNAELASVLRDIIDTPISPELLPPNPDNSIEQKTEDLVGPYELHDFFLWHMLRYGSTPRKILMLAGRAFDGRYDRATILHWLKTFYRRFFSQQFKRSCMPDGVKAGSVSLSPRGDWRMPSDASSRMWIRELEEIENQPRQ